jgi:spermidine synthase
MFPLYAGIFFVSLATLMLEISLSRIFSVAVWYHFAFMIISVALLGFGASGAFLSIYPRIFEKNVHQVTTYLAWAFSFSCVGSLVIICRLTLDPFQISAFPSQIFILFIYYLALFLPFFFAGLCISLLLCRFPDRISKLYFFNLMGSGCGCFLTIFLIPILSNSGTVVFATLIVLVSALFFNANVYRWKNILTAILIFIWLLLVMNAPSIFQLKIAKSKVMSVSLYKLGIKPLLTKWNAFSRIDVFDNGNYFRYAPGLSIKYASSYFPPQKAIYIDGDAVTPLLQYDKNDDAEGYFHYFPSSMAFQIKENPKICIIGAGGGFDVFIALNTTDASKITAVEINPNIVNVVKDHFKGSTYDIYDHPKVNWHVAEGRNFIANNNETFDVIQLSLVDTWAAASSGAYSLTENYLYTTEAFVQYINHLSSEGILTLTRWINNPPKENLRLAALATAALEKTGVSNPEDHIVFIHSKRVAVMLLKKTPFNSADIEKIRQISDKFGFGIIFAPGLNIKTVFSDFLLSKNKEIFYQNYPFNITPSDDDKPFYFHFYSWKHLKSQLWKVVSIDRNNISHLILFAVFGQALLLSILFILLPLFFSKRSGLLHSPAKGVFLLYFASIGMGFMFIEIPLMQKFILFLGHPIYSLSVVLFSILVFAGLGSFCTEKIKDKVMDKLKVCLIVLACLILFYNMVLPKLLSTMIGLKLPFRMAVTIFLLSPLGFFMGMPFPLALRLVNQIAPRLMPWVWGVNGCLSVLSSILSVMIALSFGFSSVLLCAAIAYLIALEMSFILRRRYTNLFETA